MGLSSISIPVQSDVPLPVCPTDLLFRHRVKPRELPLYEIISTSYYFLSRAGMWVIGQVTASPPPRAARIILVLSQFSCTALNLACLLLLTLYHCPNQAFSANARTSSQ
jgi:hypothetical protein